MAKPEWGVKRLCTGCGARFYDLNRQPIECPKCNAVVDPEQGSRLKRSRNAAPEPVAKPKPAKVVDVVEGDVEVEIDDDDDDDVIEDTLDLADDDDDLEELVDGVDKDKVKDGE